MLEFMNRREQALTYKLNIHRKNIEKAIAEKGIRHYFYAKTKQDTTKPHYTPLG